MVDGGGEGGKRHGIELCGPVDHKARSGTREQGEDHEGDERDDESPVLLLRIKLQSQ